MHIEGLIDQVLRGGEQKRDERCITSCHIELTQALRRHARALTRQLLQAVLVHARGHLWIEAQLSNPTQPLHHLEKVGGRGSAGWLSQPDEQGLTGGRGDGEQRLELCALQIR